MPVKRKTTAGAYSRSNEMHSGRGHVRILECRTCIGQVRPQAAARLDEDGWEASLQLPWEGRADYVA